MKADRYGVVTLEGRHRCSADRANAGREPVVGLRALEVEVLDSSGKHLATHPRAYGQASTNSEDPSMQLALLCNKPASWPDSRVRDALPDPLRQWLDRQDRQTRNEALQTLKRVDRESGGCPYVICQVCLMPGCVVSCRGLGACAGVVSVRGGVVVVVWVPPGW